VNYFIANSHFVARRIKNIYHREAHLIYPPADTENFVPAACKGDYYFSAARMVPYKKMDLIVAAFNKMPDKKLVITGAGKGLKKIQALAASNIVIKNRLTAAEFREYMIQAKGFVYAAEEDFGIVMAEAQAAGVPVIAYRKGGASEIVQDGVTGILFDYQTEASIIGAIQRFETISFDTNIIVARAQMFSVASFKENFSNYVSACCQDFFNLST
jgi:glycosyltransferase involved in cell wall biosynthesis